MEERINRLEENVYFLEESLKSLDSRVVGQERQLEQLRKALELIQAKLVEVGDALEARPLPAPAPENPPHYREWG